MKKTNDTPLFLLIAELHKALKLPPINTYAGCWEHDIDEHWRISLNAHDEPTKDSQGTEIAPYHAFVYFNGWAAGYFNPYGGSIVAGGLANEDSFAEALEAATRKVEAEP